LGLLLAALQAEDEPSLPQAVKTAQMLSSRTLRSLDGGARC